MRASLLATQARADSGPGRGRGRGRRWYSRAVHQAWPAALVLVASTVLALAPERALAQRRGDARGSAAAAEADARRHFESGAAMFQLENYDGALAEFQESYRIRPVPVVLFNIAQTFKILFRYTEAIDAYEEYLRTEEQIPADRRQAVRRTIADLRRAVASISFDVDVDGTMISVDGREVGRSPLGEAVRLAAGTRRVQAEHDGYVTVRLELAVVGGRSRTVRILMPPADTAATLHVRASQPGSRVRIDGLDLGDAPVERSLGPGGHMVEVVADGFETYRRELVLTPRQRRDIVAELERERGLFERWWFWTGVGAVVAGGVILAVALSSGGQRDPICGGLGCTAALTAP